MRTLHLHCRSWFGRQLNIDDSDEQTLLYYADFRSKKPERIITRHVDHTSMAKEKGLRSRQVGIPVGSVASRPWSSGFDIEVSGNPLSLESAGLFSSDYKISSSVFSGTWKSAGFMSSDLKLVDSSGQIIAKLEYTSLTPFKLGKLHVSQNIGQELMDLVVVTCIAMIERRSRGNDAHTAHHNNTAGTDAAAAAMVAQHPPGI